ncbi:MAG: hypothetical protein ACREJC_14390 [Tepidisphaeraceae bacterium]
MSSQSSLTSPQRNVILGAAVLLAVIVGLTVWAWARRAPDPAKFIGTDSFAQLSAEQKKPFIDQFEAGGIRNLIENDKLSESEKENSLLALAQAHQARMLDEYFSLDSSRRKAVLDRQIDQHESFRKLVQDPATQPSKPGRFVRKFGPGHERDMMEKTPPDLRARMAEFARDMSARRAERGLPGGFGDTMIVRVVK